ncbi:YDG domain-containing protein At5g47150-like [Impatiens glandulifera]|uniref:YDG domain-containing protein At5g47150-like n=1 Tax=Impatiens glandulifera TaxID=253017 RepID=UPI001FB169B2|nr:YDG domain-containing protein At5g47150-like [Impatiens glandulifera]
MTKLDYLGLFKKQKTRNSEEEIDSNLNRKMGKQKIEFQSGSSSLPIVGSSMKTKDEKNEPRERVLKILRVVRIIYDEYWTEGRNGQTSKTTRKRRPDLKAAKVVEERFGKCLPAIGSIPGVEIGDKFNFRVELALVGIHMLLQNGIDTISFKKTGEKICTSIVATDAYYDNDMKDPDYLDYSGQGGFVSRNRKEVEDQKLEGGNLALMNSKTHQNEVRVIRGRKENGKPVYIYDGLYLVEDCRQVRGRRRNLIFKFGLRRIPGQPKLPKGF